MNSLVQWAYRRIRSREFSGDVVWSALLSLLSVKALDALRGCVLGVSYAPIGSLHFRGARVSVRNRRFLSVGRYVSFATGVSIDAFGKNGIVLGRSVTVAAGASLMASGVISEPGIGINIGDRTAIGINNVVWGQGGVSIGKDCLLGPNVVVVSENHVFVEKDRPIRDQGYARGQITIGDNCWLGAGVVVTAGVSIGEGCVVGANSVVRGDLSAGSVAVGTPAKVVSTRNGY